MFLESLRKRNPELIRVAAKLHREKRISPNTYVLDLDAIRQNIRKIKEQAKKFNLRVYPMTKQIGRNPFVLKIIREEDLGPPVAVDWMGARQLSEQGIRIGHIGHLVQVPHTEVESILKLRPEVWTVFSLEKAKELSKVARYLGVRQKVLLRVAGEKDVFYPGQAGGILEKQVIETAKKICDLPNVELVGVTSFPCLLFDVDRKDVYTTPNLDTILKAAQELEDTLGIAITQINAPGTTSAVTMQILAKKGATHVEPGHGMSGSTPLHAFKELPEIPAIVYLTEISHIYTKQAYCYGGGLYVDPVIPQYPLAALVGATIDTLLEQRLNVELVPLGGIDYYGMIELNRHDNVKTGDTVIFGFRPQMFITRANIAAISGIQKKTPKIEGVFCQTWLQNGKLKNHSEFESSLRSI